MKQTISYRKTILSQSKLFSTEFLLKYQLTRTNNSFVSLKMMICQLSFFIPIKHYIRYQKVTFYGQKTLQHAVFDRRETFKLKESQINKLM